MTVKSGLKIKKSAHYLSVFTVLSNKKGQILLLLYIKRRNRIHREKRARATGRKERVRRERQRENKREKRERNRKREKRRENKRIITESQQTATNPIENKLADHKGRR